MKLRDKFLAALVPAGMVAALLVLFLIQRSVHQIVLGGLERGATDMAAEAARNAAPDFESAEESRLLPLLHEVQRRQGALYAAAFDVRGKVVAHTTVTQTGKAGLDALVRKSWRSGKPASARDTVRGEPVLVIAVPVWPAAAPPPAGEVILLSGLARMPPREHIGALELAIPLTPALQTENRLIRDISMIALVVGGAVMGLVVFLVRGMLRPIQVLTTGIGRVTSGRYDAQVPVLTSDELGELAANFNKMSDELSRTTVSKEYVEGVLENMADLLFVADPQGRIRTVNRAAVSALGQPAERLLERPLWEIFVDPPAVLRPPGLEVAAAAGQVRDVEVMLKGVAGGRIAALFSVSLLTHRDGNARGFIGVAKDITERKRVDAALLAAKSAAERSSRELEAFSYSVAHDLRAPLRVLDGYSQMLLEDYSGNLDKRGTSYLQRLRDGSRNMAQLIDDLLDLSRITRGTMREEKTDLSAMVSRIAAELRGGQPGRRVEFVIAPGLEASCDPSLLRLALANLLANSWKYTSKHPSARIEFGAERAGGELVYFVRDDGAGFDMAFSKRLFQPFSRLHGSSEFEGTGIGLATVQRVIERHGGRVWAQGAVEKGATVYFTLGTTAGGV